MTRPWLEIAASVKRLQVRQYRAMAAELRPLGISPVQWDALRHLHQHPNASLHDLAQLTFQTDQGFGTLAARMVEMGLLRRVQAPGRAVQHEITERGQELRLAADAVIETALQGSLGRVAGEQLAQFDAALIAMMPPPPTLPIPPGTRRSAVNAVPVQRQVADGRSPSRAGRGNDR